MKWIEQFRVYRNSIRDVYTHNGYEIAHTKTRYFLDHNHNQAVECSRIILDNEFNEEIIKKCGGYIETHLYTDEGFGQVAFESSDAWAIRADTLTSMKEFIDLGLFEKLQTGDNDA